MLQLKDCFIDDLCTNTPFKVIVLQPHVGILGIPLRHDVVPQFSGFLHVLTMEGLVGEERKSWIFVDVIISYHIRQNSLDSHTDYLLNPLIAETLYDSIFRQTQVQLFKMVVMVTMHTSILAQICIMIQEGSPLSPNPREPEHNETMRQWNQTKNS